MRATALKVTALSLACLCLASGPAAAAPAATGAATGPGADKLLAAPGDRGLPRASRHALIIAIGEYTSPAIPVLHGVKFDIESARKMAAAMLIPPENIRTISHLDATAARIEQEIAELNTRTRPGDRVFFYFSGHGSRWYDAAIKKDGCVEALMAADGKPLTNERIAAALKPISDKTDKLMVFYDACHSGGVVGKPLATTRALPGGAARLTPKFNPANASECAKPVNIKTRAFTGEAVRIGGLPENIVQISSSRPDEISFDDAQAGGLATQAWRDCMLGAAGDLDGSGGVSVSEIAVCAQARIDGRFTHNQQFGTQHFTIGGNKFFIPGWFSSDFQNPAAAEASAAPAPQQPVAFAAPAPAPAPAPPAQTAGTAFTDVLAQRDARRKVTVRAKSNVLRIGQDKLDLSVTSSHDGYLYLILLGSDNRSFYMLFPNDRDNDNAIKAGQTLRLPRPDWMITAQGPAGTDRMLAVVAESPRNLGLLGNARSGPFLQTLTDSDGRANLQWLLGSSIDQATADCSNGGRARDGAIASKCSDAFGAALAEIVEK